MGLSSIVYKTAGKICSSNRYLSKKYHNQFPHVEWQNNQNFSTLNLIGRSQSRGFSTLKMIAECLKEIKSDKHFSFRFFINDKYNEEHKNTDFYYCTDDESRIENLIPDFAFDGWPEAGINNYNDETAEISLKGKTKWQDSRMLWIGNINTNKVRHKLLEIGRQRPDIFNFQDTYVDNYTIYKKDVPFINLPDHTNFKYLIDVEGNSYSARLKFLLHTNRVVFLQDRPWKEYFHTKLKPYVHYIPIKNNLSDLLEQYEMIEKDPALYEFIIENASKFAREHLSYTKAIQHMREVIINQINKF